MNQIVVGQVKLPSTGESLTLSARRMSVMNWLSSLISEYLAGICETANTWGLLKKPDRLQRSLFQRWRADKLTSIRAIHDCYNC